MRFPARLLLCVAFVGACSNSGNDGDGGRSGGGSGRSGSGGEGASSGSGGAGMGGAGMGGAGMGGAGMGGAGTSGAGMGGGMMPPVVMECPGAPAPAAGCTVTAGDASKLLVGTVLTPGMVFHGGKVLVDAAGVISCVGCDCAAGGATQIVCPSGVISPGLINTHDHITYTQNSPGTDSGERYEQRHDWRRGLRGHTSLPAPGGASQVQVQWGELRFLFGGSTSIVGSGSAPGFLRNLDKSAQEGLNHTAVHFETFPLGDTGGQQLTSGCGYNFTSTAANIANDRSFEPHIAEGIDQAAHNEFVCASSMDGGGQDLVQPQSAFIHAVGLLARDYGAMAVDNTGLIWSPRSNVRLYGDTAQVTTAARLGVQIALGTDWTPSGSMSLLRELKCADLLNQTYYDHFFTDESLWMMVTANAAAITATDDAIGILAAGRTADIAIFDGSARADHRAVIEAEAKDVLLVLRTGKVLYGDAATVDAVAPGCDHVDVCGAMKSACVMGEVNMSYDQLKTAAGASNYPAFFCGTPDNEPTCVPKRPASVSGSTIYTGQPSATDADGDGIPDAMDNCPRVFNPVRPLDGGMQADADGDGMGDPCDPCPLNMGSMCTLPNPDDSDGDGVANAMDNCPMQPNPAQDDMDMDGKGDACDACPMQANPGMAGCSFTIPQVRNPAAAGHPAVQSRVTVSGVVTALKTLPAGGRSMGFWIEDPTANEFGGLMVFTGATAPAVAVGNTVTVTGTYEEYMGITELTTPTVMVTDMGTTLPATIPHVVMPAEIATGGARRAPRGHARPHQHGGRDERQPRRADGVRRVRGHGQPARGRLHPRRRRQQHDARLRGRNDVHVDHRHRVLLVQQRQDPPAHRRRRRHAVALPRLPARRGLTPDKWRHPGSGRNFRRAGTCAALRSRRAPIAARPVRLHRAPGLQPINAAGRAVSRRHERRGAAARAGPHAGARRAPARRTHAVERRDLRPAWQQARTPRREGEPAGR